MTLRVSQGAGRRMMFPSQTAGAASASVLLMHFDGTNGSTTFTDVYGTAMTGGAGASISTAQSEFGGASATGGSSTAICTANSTSLTLWDFLTGNLTIECWVRPLNSRAGVFSTSSGKGPAFGMFNGNIYFGASGLSNWNRSATLNDNTWYALAWVRSSGVSIIYLNGTAVGATQADTNSYHPSLDTPFTTNIGYDARLSGVATPGFIDELRISNVARYTSNYTPTGPFAS